MSHEGREGSATKDAKNTKISVVTLRLALILSVAVVLGSCRGAEQKASAPAPAAEPAFNLAIQPIAPPVQGTSMQSQLTASARGVVLSWLEQKDASATLKFSELTGDAWAAAKTIASSEKWFISDDDVPTVMRMID